MRGSVLVGWRWLADVVHGSLNAHRHEHVQRAFVAGVLHHGRGAGIGELEQRALALELVGDVEQVARVEADLERGRAVLDRDLFRRAAALGIVHRQHQLVLRQVELHRAAALAGDGRDAVHRIDEFRVGDLQLLVVRLRDHAPVVGEGAVDELGGERQRADLEARLGRRDADHHLVAAGLDQPMQLVHGLARQDHARHAFSALRHGKLGLGEAVPVGRDRAQRAAARARGHVEVDAVEVVARLLGGDGKARLVDQALELARLQLELVRELARRQVREILRRQRLQGKARLAAGDGDAFLLWIAPHFHLGTVRQLAHDVVQNVRRNRQRTGRRNLRADALADLALEIRRLEHQRVAGRLQQHVGQDRDGRAPLDDAGDMAQRSEQFTAFDHELHDFASP